MKMKDSSLLPRYKYKRAKAKLREDTHKKGFFLVVGPLRVYPPYTFSGPTTKKNT